MAKGKQGMTRLHVEGGAPLLPNLAAVMPAGPALMDAMASEFAPVAARLSTQQIYWLALNGWITDRLSGPIMDGQVSAKDIGEQAWAVYASACFGGRELRENWGMPPVIQRLGIKMLPPYAELQTGLASNMAQRMAAINDGGDHCLHILPSLLREDSITGIVYNMAYNAGVQVVKTEDPPIGQRRPQRKPRPATVRINTRDFMRVDYDIPAPHYLKVWRSAFERAVTANPAAYEKAIVGEAGQADLRGIWKHGVLFGNTTWGGDAQDKWSEAYFSDSLHWSTVVNFGLEAAGLAAFVAVINQDPEAARRAVMANALYLGAGSGWLVGMLDTASKLPTVTRV